MKIAIQNPSFVFLEQEKNFNGYNYAFLQKHADYIYLTSPLSYFKYKKRLIELGIDLPILLTMRSLNHAADILMHFGGEPYLAAHMPPSQFLGAKIWHLLDYVFRPKESLRALKNGGVTHIMGYCRHDRYCSFFKRFYSPYIGKIIDVPFGYTSRFYCYTPLQKRDSRCIALGAVNPVNDPLCAPGVLEDYISFYKDNTWTHALRRQIAVRQQELQFLVASKLPLFPETKNPSYDPVAELNGYTFFINDEGLMNFPPARTYEGIACGAIMVAADNPIYKKLGFVPGKNYIAFKRDDLQDFIQQLLKYKNQPNLVRSIQKQSLKLAKHFNQASIAARLKQQIAKVYA